MSAGIGNRLVAVVGTNASGKSALGVELAARFAGEVVSADSRQVFRRLDLGTGKLERAARGGIPHHLIDILDPGEQFSLADFQQRAYAAIDGTLARGRLPILVGGTALYVRAVVDGYELVAAPPDPALRRTLDGRSDDELHELLRESDPVAAGAVDRRNRVRMIRAIEIATAGIPYGDTRRSRPRYDVLQLGLTWKRDLLRERIERRLRRRLELGMVEEVEQLLRDGVGVEWLDALGLEYRAVVRYLSGEIGTEDELVDVLGTEIYRFAKRQLAWFAKDPRVVWLDTAGGVEGQAAKLVAAFLEREPAPAGSGGARPDV